MDSPPPAQPPVEPSVERAQAAAFGAWLFHSTPRPRVVPTLVGLNVAVFALMITRGVPALSPGADSLLAWGANYGARTLGGQPWRLLANTFLHFGLLHLGFNMWALWSGGGLIERLYGPSRFAALYLVAGLTGSLTSVIAQPHVVSAGASGAVFGIYGALASFLYRQRGVIPSLVLQSLRRSAVTVIGLNVIIGFSQPGIDNAAHLGGLLGGAAAGLFLVRPLLPGPRTSGRWRPVFAIAAAALLATGAARFLPRPADLIGELAQFSADEGRLVDAYNELVTRVRTGSLTDVEFADELDHTLLPSWRQTRSRLARQTGWPARQAKTISNLLQYAAARDEGWAALAEALRSHDPAAAARADAAQRRLDSLLDQLKQH